ncbi:hypothetical protein [Shewanella sp.]|uniref:hypothetical protein n=1 Tax=Shewanella sp. TaxID=50422 RepID=UPI004047B01C
MSMPAFKRARRTVSIKKVQNDKITKADVKEIVRKAMANETEMKYAIAGFDNVAIKAAIPSGTVTSGVGNFFRLMPDVYQSTTGGAGNAYNERIGNEIVLKEMDIHGYVNFAPAAVTGVDYKNAKLAVRVMILRAKAGTDPALIFNNMPTDSLIRFGNNTSGVAGPTSYDGFPLDSFRDINTDVFTVNYDRVHQLDAPTTLAGSSSVTISAVPTGLKMIRHKIKFGKNGLKLFYSQSSDRQPNNNPYFMVIGYSSLTQAVVPDDDIVRATFNITSSYTDS